MIEIILFTLAALCLFFWGGAILAVLAYIVMGAWWALCTVAVFLLHTVSFLIWSVWWLFDRKAATEAMRNARGDGR